MSISPAASRPAKDRHTDLEALKLIDHLTDFHILFAAGACVAELLLELVDFLFVLAEHSLVIQHLIHLGRVLDLLRTRGKLERRQRFLGMYRSICHCVASCFSGFVTVATPVEPREPLGLPQPLVLFHLSRLPTPSCTSCRVLVGMVWVQTERAIKGHEREGEETCADDGGA